MSDSSGSKVNEESESKRNAEEAEASPISQEDRTPIAHKNIDGAEWKPDQGNQRNLIPFTKRSGVYKNLSELLIIEESLGFYSALVDDGIFEYIVDETNLYTTQTLKNDNYVTPNARVHDCFPTVLSTR